MAPARRVFGFAAQSGFAVAGLAAGSLATVATEEWVTPIDQEHSVGGLVSSTASGSGDHLLLQVGARGGIRLLQSEPSCAALPNVEQRCSADGCKVLADQMRGRSCSQYCSESGLTCVGAWEEVDEDCNVKEILTCDEAGIPTSDLLCECAVPGAASTSPSNNPDDHDHEVVLLPTFFWNVHWECSMSKGGASHTCKQRIGERFVELARQSNAQIVASVELEDTMSQPSSFSRFGLHGWTQVNGPCKKGNNGDAAALAFAPGWTVLASAGGCLRHDYDTRAFAVARVSPPTSVRVRGCPSLCVVAIHAPHTSITKGKDDVQQVCGSAAEHCAVAMGDWNIPVGGLPGLWADIIGGASPTVAAPDERTCCWPESDHYGVFDHLATNVPGAMRGQHTVYPYQLLEEHPTKQHRPVSASVALPAGGASLASSAASAMEVVKV